MGELIVKTFIGSIAIFTIVVITIILLIAGVRGLFR